MKKIFRFLLPAMVAAAVASCSSGRKAVSEESIPATPLQPSVPVNVHPSPAGQEGMVEKEWHNVTVPVKVELLQPKKMSLSGTATMVRGEYVLISLRFFGFEVGRVCVTPTDADVVLKQPSKIWLHESVDKAIKKLGIDFVTLQETLLGDRTVLKKVPRNFKVDIAGTDQRPTVTVSTTLKGKPAQVCLSWELDKAKWNQSNPRTFETPGSGYTQTTVEQLMKMVGAVGL